MVIVILSLKAGSFLVGLDIKIKMLGSRNICYDLVYKYIGPKAYTIQVVTWNM